MRILMIGDIVGQLGQETLFSYLPLLKNRYDPDVVIVNGENAAPNGRGIRRSIVHKFLAIGVDCITLGNHAWGQVEIFDFIDQETGVVRPANFPVNTPGRGFMIISKTRGELAVVNLLGRTFMDPIECPFRTMDKILKEIPSSVPILVDFHAEATSEKQALAWYLDGKVSFVVGTHTHVQTADERILPGGTGYLTDVGMVGPYDGIIGMEKEGVIKKFITQLPVRFGVAKGRYQFNALLIDLDKQNKKVVQMRRFRIDEDNPLIN
jgi:2',3'-cyclic-nucleotide 2'-phosphodiesterase